jgi:crotonobetainyl-CoA:carnitine CoA-transferase CaiB-like acyl-CoA transferase
MTVLGRPELVDDSRFATNAARLANVAELAAIISDLIGDRDQDELARELNDAGVPASPVKPVPDALTAAQTLHRELFIDNGIYRGVGVPIKLSRSRPRRPRPPLPKGADTEQVLRALGLAAAAAQQE